MSVFDKLACQQNIRDEKPNQELAKDLAASRNAGDIGEIARNLFNKDKNIRHDCIKVLYEIGYTNPELIRLYAGDFLKLIGSKDNRMAWGAMIALSTVAFLESDIIFENIALVYAAMKTGSVITIDNGIKVLSAVASCKAPYCDATFPFFARTSKSMQTQRSTAACGKHFYRRKRTKQRSIYRRAQGPGRGNYGFAMDEGEKTYQKSGFV